MARRTRTARTRNREHEDVEELHTFAQFMERDGIEPTGTVAGRRYWRVQCQG